MPVKVVRVSGVRTAVDKFGPRFKAVMPGASVLKS